MTTVGTLSRRRMALLTAAAPAAWIRWPARSILAQETSRAASDDDLGAARQIGDRLREAWRPATFGDVLREPTSLDDTVVPMRRRIAEAAVTAQDARAARSAADREATLDATAARRHLAESKRVARLAGTLNLGPDDTIVVPEAIAVLDLRAAVLKKEGGADPILEIRHDCQVVGGRFDFRAVPMKSYLSGAAIRFTKANGGGISGTQIAVTDGPAVLARDSRNLMIAFNEIVNRSETRRVEHSEIPHALLFYGGSAEHVVVGNNIAGPCGVGVMFQSGERDQGDMARNIVADNTISDVREYGICFYSKTDTARRRVALNLVSGNRVAGVRGDVRNKNAEGRIYGTGIYIQGIQQSVICFNEVSEVCQETTSHMLGPAAISVVNTGSACIYANRLRDSAWYGIYLKDPSQRDKSGNSVVARNTIAGCRKGGIRIACVRQVTMTDNEIDSPEDAPDVEMFDICETTAG